MSRRHYERPAPSISLSLVVGLIIMTLIIVSATVGSVMYVHADFKDFRRETQAQFLEIRAENKKQFAKMDEEWKELHREWARLHGRVSVIESKD